MYVTKEEREVITKTLGVVVEELYQTPKNNEANDVILTPAQVSEEFPFITKNFLSRYGWYLPRVKVEKWDDETCKHKFGYSRNRIIDWLHSGVFRQLKPFIVTEHGKEV